MITNHGWPQVFTGWGSKSSCVFIYLCTSSRFRGFLPFAVPCTLQIQSTANEASSWFGVFLPFAAASCPTFSSTTMTSRGGCSRAPLGAASFCASCCPSWTCWRTCSWTRGMARGRWNRPGPATRRSRARATSPWRWTKLRRRRERSELYACVKQVSGRSWWWMAEWVGGLVVGWRRERSELYTCVKQVSCRSWWWVGEWVGGLVGVVGWLVWLVADKNAEEGVQDEQNPMHPGNCCCGQWV